jgi:hypothetical protein
VAVRENAPMLVEENYKENYGDIDPNSPEFIALALLKTKQFFKRSATLAVLLKMNLQSRQNKQWSATATSGYLGTTSHGNAKCTR